ncbi:hypothetical protein [Streptomyces sp. TR06-5]|uniref:hypothetical protein n=1 Tax=unclassified Streptomyces TaxID=2593676 RepID=UPI0039A11F39
MTAARPDHPAPGPLPPERTAPAAAPPGSPAPQDRAADPLIPPGPLPALAGAALAGLLAGTAVLPLPVFVCAVVVLQGLTAAGWFRLNGMWPARQGIALAFLAGVAADVAMLAVDEDDAMTAVVGTFGVWALLNLVLHLRNRSAPEERLYALTAALTATALTVTVCGWLAAAAAGGPGGAATGSVVVGAAAVAAAVLLRAAPLPSVVSLALSALAAAGAGHLASLATGFPAHGEGALLGAAAGLCALTGLRVASYDFPSRFVHMTAGVALPAALAAPAVYGLGHLLG